MVAFINAMEELTIKEAKAQIEELRADLKQQISLAEVVAYALNRLPCLYATTQYGWVQQRSKVYSEFYEQINDFVHRAILAVQMGDPLHDSTPIPEAELNSQARSLAKLQKILNKNNLRWRDVPTTVESALARFQTQEATTTFRGNSYTGSSRNSHITAGLVGYLKRSKMRREASEGSFENDSTVSSKGSSWSNNVKAGDLVAIEHGYLESYVTKAKLGFSNVLENIVVSVTQHFMQKLSPEQRSRVSIHDVVACALNQLPPLYATSDRGLRYQREYAKSQLKKEILLTVRQAIFQIMRCPNRGLPPLPFEKFNREQEEALRQLKRILNREDITSLNVADVVGEVLNESHVGETTAFFIAS